MHRTLTENQTCQMRRGVGKWRKAGPNNHEPKEVGLPREEGNRRIVVGSDIPDRLEAKQGRAGKSEEVRWREMTEKTAAKAAVPKTGACSSSATTTQPTAAFFALNFATEST